MSEILLLLSIISLLTSVVLAIVFVVKKIIKKRTISGKVSLAFLGLFLCLFIAFFMIDDISSGLFLISFLSFFVFICSLVVGIVLAIIKKKKAKAFITCMIALAITVAGTVLSSISWDKTLSNPSNYEISIKTDLDFEVVDGNEPIEVKTSNGFEKSPIKSSYHNVYDVCDYKLLLNNDNATVDQCLQAIENNKSLKKVYKDYFKDFVKRINRIYPNANLSVLYKNLRTLKVIELEQRDYMMKSLAIDSLGCYRIDENIIYIPKGTKYIEGEFGFQVLIHEFCHAARTSWWEENGVNNRITEKSELDTTLLCESLNSAFSCSLLNYYEWDIAYQVPSNYLRIMLECMDNYELTDYMNHSETYFLSKLDEFTGHTNYASVIWKLISVQRSDWERDLTDISAEEYYPIYDYLCKMYYDKYITSNMNEAERKKVADDLVYKAFYDSPEGYKIDSEYFYKYLENY